MSRELPEPCVRDDGHRVAAVGFGRIADFQGPAGQEQGEDAGAGAGDGPGRTCPLFQNPAAISAILSAKSAIP